MSNSERLLTVSEAVESRIACRDFLDKEVSIDLIKKILNEARRAPSSSNLQPWKIYLIYGENKSKLRQIIQTKIDNGVFLDLPLQFKVGPGKTIPAPGFQNTMKQNFPKYYDRYSKLGKKVYGSQGIARQDHKSRMEALFRAYNFFGAPVGLLITIDKGLTLGSYPDLGIMAQTIMLLCEQYGLSTCSIVAWALQHNIVRNALNIDQNELIFCGMAIGYKNDQAPVNQFKRDRMSFEEMVVVPEINDIQNIKFESKWMFKFKVLSITLRENYLPIDTQYLVAIPFVAGAVICWYKYFR